MQFTILIRNLLGLLLLLAGIYLSISAIIALPLLEEEAGYKQADFYALNENIDKRRDLTIKNIESLDVDSMTIVKYNYVSEQLNNKNKFELISSRINPSKKNLIENIRDGADKCKDAYNNIGVIGKIQKNEYAAQLLQAYADFCIDSKQRAFDTFQAITIQTSALYEVSKNDKSKDYRLTRQEKEKMKGLFFKFVPESLRMPAKPKNNSTRFFIPAEWALRERSQNLIIIIGLLGFALFGAVVGAANKPNFTNVTPDKTRSDDSIYFDIIVTLVKGFSASLVVYLSIKGGFSLITTTNSDTVNPYLILFLCFISAVFSDSIWDWARTKLVGSTASSGDKPTTPDPDQAVNENKNPEDPAPKDEDFASGAEIPAGLPQDPAQIPAIPSPFNLSSVSDLIINEAIASKLPEWKAAFEIIDATPAKHKLPDGTEINAINFKIDRNHLADPAYHAELPRVITYTASDTLEYNIPIELQT